MKKKIRRIQNNESLIRDGRQYIRKPRSPESSVESLALPHSASAFVKLQSSPKQPSKMSYHRVFVALALLATVAMTLSASMPNDVVLGSRAPGDYLLQREFIKKPSKTLQIVKDRRTFPGNNFSKITQMRLLDQNKKGNGATAVVVNGGPGLSYATVEFKSKRGHSIDFIVEIYGR